MAGLLGIWGKYEELVILLDLHTVLQLLSLHDEKNKRKIFFREKLNNVGKAREMYLGRESFMRSTIIVFWW